MNLKYQYKKRDRRDRFYSCIDRYADKVNLSLRLKREAWINITSVSKKNLVNYFLKIESKLIYFRKTCKINFNINSF